MDPRYCRWARCGSHQCLPAAGRQQVQIARNVKARLDEIHSKLPPVVSITSWYDQSRLVTSSAASVRDANMIGAMLAALVLLVFLKSWRVTLIALLVVPASLVAPRPLNEW